MADDIPTLTTRRTVRVEDPQQAVEAYQHAADALANGDFPHS
jgi:hypothetical protein